MTLARVSLLALCIAIGGCGISSASRERFGQTPQPARQDCAVVYVVRPLDSGSYVVLHVLGAGHLRPVFAGSVDGQTTEYLNFRLTPPSGAGVLFCATVFGLLSPREFSTVQSAMDAIQAGTVSGCVAGVHWLIPTRETKILGQASRYALTADKGAFSRPWYVVRKKKMSTADVLTCTTPIELLSAVVPVLRGGDDLRLPPSVRTFSRTGSRAADAGSYVLRLDRAGLIHVLCVEATLFREVYLEADDRSGSFDTSESVDLVVVGTVFEESFDDVTQAIAAIESDSLTPEGQVGVWVVPAQPTRAFLAYDRSRARTTE